ncbi:MAG: hypothetical protein ACR2QV_01535 [Gammaproteobacteria bacterium]
MSEDTTFIACDEHGQQQATCVCQHIVQTLADGEPRGFWWANDPDSARPDAWCSECEARVQDTGGEWNDENEGFAGVTLMCGACYDRAKEVNLSANSASGNFPRISF